MFSYLSQGFKPRIEFILRRRCVHKRQKRKAKEETTGEEKRFKGVGLTHAPCIYYAFILHSCLVSTKGTKKGKKTRQPRKGSIKLADHAMESVGGKSVAGKAMSSMTGEKLAHVQENLGKTLKKNVNKAVKQTVLEVFLFFIPFQIAFNTSSNMTTRM